MARRGWSTSNYLMCSTPALTAAPLTMSCWAKSSNVSAYQVLMDLHNGASSGNCFQLVQTSTLLQMLCVDGSGGHAEATTSSVVTANTWYNAVGIINTNGRPEVWFNADPASHDASGNGAFTPVGISRMSIGANSSNTPGASPFAPGGTGDIADCAIWNVALDDMDVLALSLGVSPLLIRPEALIAYWPMVGTYSPSINLKKNSQVMTIQGALTQSPHPRLFTPPGARSRTVSLDTDMASTAGRMLLVF